MNVSQLIDKLITMPQDAEVVFFNKDTSKVAKGGYRITNIGIEEANFEIGKEGKFSSKFVFMDSDHYDILDGNLVWHLGDDRYPKFDNGFHVQKI